MIRHRAEARQQRHRVDILEHRMRVMTSLQIVIRDPWTEMMNVVEPNVAGEPLQDLRQFVKGTAL